MNVTANRFVALGDCARVNAGFPFRGAVDSLDDGPVGVIQMRNVEEAGVDWSSIAYVTLPTKREPDLLAEGDVIFTTRGKRNFALVLGDIPGPAVCSTHFFILQPLDPGELLPAFLAWQINQKPAQDHFQQSATGSYILNITRAAIESVPITIPPLEVQRAIVALTEAAQHEAELINALVANRQRQLDAVALQTLTPERFPA